MTSHALDPPVTNCHTFSDPLPLERDILYGRPLGHGPYASANYWLLTSVVNV